MAGISLRYCMLTCKTSSSLTVISVSVTEIRHIFFYLLKHGGVYVKRSAKFDEKAMRRKLCSQTDVGTPVSIQYCTAFPN